MTKRARKKKSEKRLREQLLMTLPVPQEPLDTKNKMYAKLNNGLLGNTVRTWSSREEVEQSGYRGEFSLRSRQVANPVRLYHVPYEKLDYEIAKLPIEQKESGLVYCEAPPEHRKTIQGELFRPHELVFEYTRVAKPMRLAFDEERLTARGLSATFLLQHYLEARDHDELLTLLELYPGHVIEFSTFDVPVGTIPGRKTVIWEVRLY